MGAREATRADCDFDTGWNSLVGLHLAVCALLVEQVLTLPEYYRDNHFAGDCRAGRHLGLGRLGPEPLAPLDEILTARPASAPASDPKPLRTSSKLRNS